jgi:hypothetical protein
MECTELQLVLIVAPDPRKFYDTYEKGGVVNAAPVL